MPLTRYRFIIQLSLCCLLVGLVCLTNSGRVSAASYRTQNFVVSASDPLVAREVAETAELYRRQLALEWLGEELAPWQEPCPIWVQIDSNLGPGGSTSFTFVGGRPAAWQMSVQGSRQVILDSVLPHEIAHTVFATHFGCPLPRWVDEGASMMVEHVRERAQQEEMLTQFISSGRALRIEQLFTIREYPSDVMPLYTQGYSLASFLIERGGKRKFMKYVGEALSRNDWVATTEEYYGYRDLSELQSSWLASVVPGT